MRILRSNIRAGARVEQSRKALRWLSTRLFAAQITEGPLQRYCGAISNG